MCRLRTAPALRVTGLIPLTVKRLPVPQDTIPLVVDHAQVFALALHDSSYFTLTCSTTLVIFGTLSSISFDRVEKIFYKQTNKQTNKASLFGCTIRIVVNMHLFITFVLSISLILALEKKTIITTTIMLIYSLFNSAATCAEGQITNTECNCNPGFSGGGAWISGPTYPECVGS